VLILNFESRGVEKEQMLKASVEAGVTKFALVNWKWTNQVGIGRRGEFDMLNSRSGSLCIFL